MLKRPWKGWSNVALPAVKSGGSPSPCKWETEAGKDPFLDAIFHPDRRRAPRQLYQALCYTKSFKARQTAMPESRHTSGSRAKYFYRCLR